MVDGSPRVYARAESLTFLEFVVAVAEHFSGLTLFAKTTSDPRHMYPLPSGPSVAGLPRYDRVGVGTILRTGVRTVRAMWSNLDRVDRIWVFGPHPFAVALIVMALLRRRAVTLGVRQDTVPYFRARMSGGRDSWPLLGALYLLEWCYRALSRLLPTTVVGPHLEALYGGPRRGLLPMEVGTIRSEQVVPIPRIRTDVDVCRLLTVGRIEPEKNPLLLVDVLAALDRVEPRRFRVTWVGDGVLRPAMAARAQELGVADLLDLPGFVPLGDGLLRYYLDSDLFVHVAVTEALPQVLSEAQACGLPIVGTDVGAVRAVLDDGRAGVLVAPDDPGALARVIRDLSHDDRRRAEFARRGLERAGERTIERTAARAAAFLVDPGVTRTP
jgi:glycosyltransferase involved in cell wall biosynthesis